GDEGAAPFVQQREGAVDVLDVEHDRADALRVLAQVAPGSSAFSERLVDDEHRAAGLERPRPLAPLMLQLGAALPYLHEVQLVDEEAPRPLQVVDVIVQRFDALEADRTRRHISMLARSCTSRGRLSRAGRAPLFHAWLVISNRCERAPSAPT